MLATVNNIVYASRVTEGMTSATRRAEILSAAAGLFAQRGYHGVSIGDLGRAVGLTGPALYRHFRGKEALLAEMLLDISQRLLTEGRRRAAEAVSPADALEALLSWHIEFALGDPALIMVQERELETVPEPQRREIRRLQRAYVEEWVRVLRQVYAGSSPDRARAAAHAVFGLLNSSPRSATALDRGTMAALLHAMAVRAFAAALS
jgi:AcrR family transcriptional regulator